MVVAAQIGPPPLDIIELGTGNVLQGTVGEMRDDALRFEAATLGTMHLSWSKITRLETVVDQAWVFEDLEVQVGTATVTQDEVRVRTIEGSLILRPRTELFAILPARPSELSRWRLKIDAGTNLNFGNSDQVSYDAAAAIVREDTVTKLSMSYKGRIGFADDMLNQNRHVGDARISVFLSKNWFLTPAFVTVTHDEAQSIDLRLTPGAGGGYHLFEHETFEWDLSFGVAYQYLDRIPGEDEEDQPPNDDVALTPGVTIMWIPVKGVTFDFAWSSNVVVTNLLLTHHDASARIGIAVNSHFSLFSRAVYVRQEQLPNPTDDNPDPVRNDLQLVFGLGLTLGS